MRQALHVRTTVLESGKIEISDPQLTPGDSVEVIVMPPEPARRQRRSALEILSESPGHRIFKTAEEVDSYLRAERDAWD